MKEIFVVFLILIPVTATYSQAQDIWQRPRQVECERTFDVTHYSIKMSVDLDNKRFTGSNRVDLFPLLGGFNSFSLDVQELEITKVIDNDGTILDFKQDENSVEIFLDKSFSADERVVVKLYYTGSNLSDGLFFHDANERYPRMVESNSWPNHARMWYPCYDHPNDKAIQEVMVTVLKSYKVLSNGALISVKEHGDSITYHWRQDKEHPTYLSMLSIAPFSVLRDSLGDLPVNYWVFQGDEENARRVFKRTPEIIQFFNTIYGYDYPWDKYDQVVGPRQGGGAEATSATILGLGVIHDEDIDKDLSWERIIAHEIAHQWWGDLITLRTWSETWMNEGFGTYSDYLYTESFRDKTEAALAIEGKKQAYLNEANTKYIRPIVFNRYNQPQDNFDRHTYQKAAAVLHMLRSQLGDEAFFKTLKHFLHKHEFGSVDTHDFKVAIKEATGRNMDWFIDQWIYKPGHPVLAISKSWDDSSKILTFSIKQIQDTLAGTPIFKFPVRVAIYKENSNTEYKNIWIKGQSEQFEWKCESEPDMLRFDVGNYLLKELIYIKDIRELLFQVSNDDVTGAIWAIGELGKFLEDNNSVALKKLSEYTLHHNNWAVRLAALNTIYDSAGRVDKKVLASASRDQHYKIRNRANQILTSN